MSRLHDVKVDEKRWKIVEIDNKNYHSYRLIDKEREEIYFLNHIIGLEQVADDEFLIFDRANWDRFRIARYKAENSRLSKLFEGFFSNFYFITDDRILFTYWDNAGSYRIGGIYSIKDNGYVEDDGKWLDSASIEVFNYEDNPDKIGLYVEEEIYSRKLGNPKLLFTVSPSDLEPNSDCYSELRGSFIKVNSKKDIQDIKSEEQEYIRVIEDYMHQYEQEKRQKAKAKLLVKSKP